MNFKNIIQSFFWGILTAVAALFLELLFVIFFGIQTLETNENTFLIIIVFSVIAEEVIKYIVVIKSINPFSQGKNILLNGWVAGAGFALVEIVLSKQKIISENLVFNPIELYRTGLLHILIFGVFAYRSELKGTKVLDFHVLSLMIMLHLLYNLSVQYINTDSIFSIANFVIIILIIYNIYAAIFVNKRLAHK